MIKFLNRIDYRNGSKTVLIKVRDVKFIETTRLHEELSIKIEDQIIKSDDSDKELSEELVGEEKESSDESEIDEEPMEITSTPNEESGRPKCGQGRPKIERTGKVGRPRKTYSAVLIESNDPTTIEEAMDRNDQNRD